MFTVGEIIYYFILLTCVILSFNYSNKSISGINFLRFALTVAFVSEFINEFVDFYFPDKSSIIANLYLPVEHICYAGFLIKNTSDDLLKKIMKAIGGIFVLFTLWFSFLYKKDIEYPGLQYNINCIIILIWISIKMLKLEVTTTIKITAVPIFWILSGLLLLYSGVFFFNGSYSYIKLQNPKLAEDLRKGINLTLNYLFYLFWIYSFLCSIRLQKLYTRQSQESY
jgi:hypothetical protein